MRNLTSEELKQVYGGWGCKPPPTPTCKPPKPVFKKCGKRDGSDKGSKGSRKFVRKYSDKGSGGKHGYC